MPVGDDGLRSHPDRTLPSAFRLVLHRFIGEPRVALRGHDGSVPEDLLKGGGPTAAFEKARATQAA